MMVLVDAPLLMEDVDEEVQKNYVQNARVVQNVNVVLVQDVVVPDTKEDSVEDINGSLIVLFFAYLSDK